MMLCSVPFSFLIRRWAALSSAYVTRCIVLTYCHLLCRVLELDPNHPGANEMIEVMQRDVQREDAIDAAIESTASEMEKTESR